MGRRSARTAAAAVPVAALAPARRSCYIKRRRAGRGLSPPAQPVRRTSSVAQARSPVVAPPARQASVERVTRETKIRGAVNLDGSGSYDVATGVGFLDHMLEQLS